MFGFLSGKPAAPEPNPTDKRIPVHFFDDSLVYRIICVYCLLVFDDVLEPKKLQSSLESLVERDGWRKLGGRLRRNAKGVLEYHVPAKFGPDRPSVSFTHVSHDMPTSAHPLASQLPRPTGDGLPTIVGDPEQIAELIRPPGLGCPTKLDNYLQSDRPVLGLHVASFRDRTLVVLHWPHVAFDGLGVGAVVGGWTKILHGKEDEVATPIGYDEDPLVTLGTKVTEPHLLEHRRVSTAGMVSYAVKNAIGLVLRAREIRMVCIPAEFWQRLHRDALAELVAEAGADAVEKPFLSEGDVFVAWWMKLALTDLERTPSRTVTCQMAASSRRALEVDLLPRGRPFISNAVGFCNMILTAGEVLSMPLAKLAQQVRLAIATQNTRAQHEAYASLVRQTVGKTPVFFGDGAMYQISFSNWQQAGLFEFDFSPASFKGPAAEGGSEGQKKKPVRAQYVQSNQTPFTYPEGFIITGKDEKGNYWVNGYREKGAWGRLEKSLEKELALYKVNKA